MDKPNDFLACPFCGFDEIQANDFSDGSWTIDCHTCGAGTGTCFDEMEARKEWNTRAGAPIHGATNGQAVGSSAWLDALAKSVAADLVMWLPIPMCEEASKEIATKIVSKYLSNTQESASKALKPSRVVLERLVSWHRAKITTTETGDELPAWILKQGARTILTAVSQSDIIEPVAESDRKLIAQLIADAS